MAKMIRPSSPTKLPYVKCPNRCPIDVAGWAWTWYENDKGKILYSEHPVCNSCGTASIFILKEKPVFAKEPEFDASEVLEQIREEVTS